ncbi:fluoride efflux transporter CrcB [Pelagicoccus mobilis]|uniref:Fluoride-specific ion channel FluC n=1 Tax=Pelagicoccus mobilis TaxID=415221 RepID=A0A934RWA5_9BACT|nr:fluoride efflux transporter CrcB [Pelagicoccus mobilis]MBK1876359.1 fluoride efflux transporter CrcB [Pelagicoccus mobilis]
MELKSILYVGLGSFVGGSLRYATIWWIDKKASGDFPLSVLAANVVGSFLIGLLLPMYSKFGWGRDAAVPLFLSVGMLGGYTTFSTFSLQTLRLLQSSHYALAGLNAAASFVACLLAVFCGWKLGQAIWG